jgi:hypothetical protein
MTFANRCQITEKAIADFTFAIEELEAREDKEELIVKIQLDALKSQRDDLIEELGNLRAPFDLLFLNLNRKQR